MMPRPARQPQVTIAPVRVPDEPHPQNESPADNSPLPAGVVLLVDVLARIEKRRMQMRMGQMKEAC